MLRDHDKDREPISIHALREEGDAPFLLIISQCVIFLSTPSARRATTRAGWMPRSGCYFYPRPPRGGRQTGAEGAAGWLNISIHALREEGDL